MLKTTMILSIDMIIIERKIPQGSICIGQKDSKSSMTNMELNMITFKLQIRSIVINISNTERDSMRHIGTPKKITHIIHNQHQLGHGFS